MEIELNTELFQRDIIKKREAKSLREAAKEIGISAATLQRIEQGKEPSLDSYIKLCFWLNKPLENFIEGMNRTNVNQVKEMVCGLIKMKVVDIENELETLYFNKKIAHKFVFINELNTIYKDILLNQNFVDSLNELVKKIEKIKE